MAVFVGVVSARAQLQLTALSSHSLLVPTLCCNQKGYKTMQTAAAIDCVYTHHIHTHHSHTTTTRNNSNTTHTASKMNERTAKGAKQQRTNCCSLSALSKHDEATYACMLNSYALIDFDSLVFCPRFAEIRVCNDADTFAPPC